MDYNNLPIRCRLCLSTSHLIKDCGKNSNLRKATPHSNSLNEQHGKSIPRSSTYGQTNKSMEPRRSEKGPNMDAQVRMADGVNKNGSVGVMGIVGGRGENKGGTSRSSLGVQGPANNPIVIEGSHSSNNCTGGDPQSPQRAANAHLRTQTRRA